ncbi:broad-complex core protein isoforms 1/2/3/4/5-like isoform X2 [Macrobrachium rosenbergii]|uniref:broad-complex core protein isoforms 1/2/3/4/5-like isoform X2 n=1 Tax=Macrobrachium rosenbergii TaxID=79674 RepID=UPI0034D70D40
MGADQQFCLRWNNFHSNITSAFESLRDDEDFVDITLACDGRQIKAHKMVLSACSPYFRSLLKGNPCQHPIVFLKDVTFSNLSSILDFMYHGEVNVSHNELATFLKTAEALKVRGLAEDEKKKDSENYNESSSPPPPRDPPDPGSPRPEEGSSAPDTHLSDSPPPKRQRRRSGNSVHSTEDTNETVLSDQQVRDTSVKNEPQDFNEEEDILSQSVDQDVIKSDVVDDDRNFGPAESVTIRSQAAMQQLQESFGSFLPGMGQSPGFLPHGATDMPRPPPYPLEGVQGLPPGISALPGPSMSQGAASQDASQGAVPSTGRLGIHTPLLSPKYEVGSTTVAAQRCPPPPPHPSIHHPLHHLHPSLENANTSSSSSSNTPTTTATSSLRPSSALDMITSSALLPAAAASLAPSSTFSPSSTSTISPVGGGANLISCLRSQVASSSVCDLPGVNNLSQHQQQQQQPPPGLPGVLEGSSGGGYHGLLGLEGCSPQLGYSNVGDAAAAAAAAAGVVTPTSLALTSLGYGPTPIARTRPPTGEEVACSVCGKILCNKYVLKTHLRDMHGPRQSMQCPVCHRMYASLNSLRAHMSGTHKKAHTLPQTQQPPQRF